MEITHLIAGNSYRIMPGTISSQVEQMIRWVVYKIENRLNGKVYIGQSRKGFNVRRSEHLSRLKLGERTHRLYEAMRKHGIENFDFSVLCHALDPNYLGELERHLIAEFDSFRTGYNMTDGGDVTSDETRQKLSKALKGRKAPWAKDNWDRRRANGTDKIDMKACTPRGEANSKSKSYLVREPSGRLLAVTGMNAFCKARGLDFKTMIDTLKGIQTHHKGYALLKRFNDYRESEYA